jgi:hypothetical protein
MINASVPHRKNHVHYASPDRVSGLYLLLHYASLHEHSRAWVGAIHTILARLEVAHG